MVRKFLDGFKTFTAILFFAGAMVGAGAYLTRAGAPGILNYQGRVAVNGQDFTGNGQFKFALINPGGTLTYWGNDGTSTTGNEPTNAVMLAVNKGLYSVILGDSSLTNMTTIPSTVFSNQDVRLRIWFNDGTNGSQLLSPDQRITASGYAFVASMADTVVDGGITTGKIADGAVTAAKIAAGTFKAPTVQKFISGSGTYTTPAGVLYIRVKMAGGGGGGGGSGGSGAGYGGNGGNTTFGGNTCFGGAGAVGGDNGPGASGGTATLSLGSGIALTGGGGGAEVAFSNQYSPGGYGGTNPFGGGGVGSSPNSPGHPGADNTGAGGSGNCAPFNVFGGGGGGAGGFIEAIITSPMQSSSYSVGAGGGAGPAGTSGFVGGAGGSGVIIVEEYYQ